MPTQPQDNASAAGAALKAQGVLIRALQDPALYDHPVREITLMETHISWVILTGEVVYKIKKAVNFGFLDFSTLEKRHFFCVEELRLNRRFAPELYLDVVVLTGSVEQPEFRGEGKPLEYAVRMRQFPQAGLLSRVAGRHQLTPALIDETVDLIADTHARIAIATGDAGYGVPKDIHYWVSENFAHIRPALTDHRQQARLDGLEQWCRREYRSRMGQLQARRQEGYVRECHGDLHLGNLAIVDGRITPFDCIEFNPKLRWIDVMSEVAFLVMDLQDRGYRALAYRFLNGYLQRTGDYAGIRVLRYYLVYRALVRAKVAVLRLGQVALDAGGRADVWREYETYMTLAGNYAAAQTPALIITHGVSGTGKSWHAARLVEELGAIQIRSDVERKRLYGYAAEAATQSGIQTGIYSSEAGVRTYTRLAELARYLVDGGYPAIVDATFLKQAERDRFRDLARQLGVPFVLLHFAADPETLRSRISKRQAAGTDASEAGIAVLDAQLESLEPLRPDEVRDSLTVDTSREQPVAGLASQITSKINVSAGD